jgi:hypothetical protein
MPDEDQAVGKIDSDVPERIDAQLSGSQRFEKVVARPEYAPSSVVRQSKRFDKRTRSTGQPSLTKQR